jgi:hypothetical protein
VDNGYPWKLEKQDRIISLFDGIELKIEEGTESTSGLGYVISNKTDQTIYYGPEYHVEIKVDNQWYYIEKEVEWDAGLRILDSDNMHSYVVNWSSYYGKLPRGEYRLVKTAIVSGEEVYLADEFGIE